MTDKSLTTIVGEDQDPIQDLTDYVNWDASRFMSQAYNGESSVSSIVFRDDLGEMGPNVNTPIIIAARNEVEVKLGPDIIWRGRFIGRTWERGVQKADVAREVVAEAEDVNAELRGIIVDGWERPPETDVQRATALGADYLDGSVRVGTDIDVTTYVPNTNLVTLPAKTYTQTDPYGVLQDIAAQADKMFFVTPDKELFYDLYTSSAYATTLFISEDYAELQADTDNGLAIVPDSGPMFAINGQRFISGVRVYYGSGATNFVDLDDGGVFSAFKGHWAETIYAPEGVTTASEAQSYGQTVLAERSQDGRTYNLSVRNADGGPLTEAQVRELKPGKRITIKSHIIPEPPAYDYYAVRIVTVQWHMPLPGHYYPTLKLERPEKMYGVGRPSGLGLCHDGGPCGGGDIDDFAPWLTSVDGYHTINNLYSMVGSGVDEVGKNWMSLTEWDGNPLDFRAKVSTTHNDGHAAASPPAGVGIFIGELDNITDAGPNLLVPSAFRFYFSRESDGDLRASASTVFATDTTDVINVGSDEPFWIRCQITDTVARMRVWRTDDAEPGTWDCETAATTGYLAVLADANIFTIVSFFSHAAEMKLFSLEMISGYECPSCIHGGPDASSGDDTDAAPAGHNHDYVAEGGLVGQALIKTTTTDWDDEWAYIESISTAETDDTLVLAPDGAGGVEFRAETGGGGGPFEEVDPTYWRLKTGIISLSNEDNTAGWLLTSGAGNQSADDIWVIQGDNAYLEVSTDYVELNSGAGLFIVVDDVKHYLAGGNGVVVPLLTADPAGGDSQDGQIYYDTALDKFRGHVNGAWTDLGSGGSSGITIEDEGTPLSTDATTLDFVGAGVTASGSGASKTITIPGGGGAGSGATVVGSADDIGASPLSVAAPGTIAAGDLIIFAVNTVNSTPNAAGPSGTGWTELVRFDTSSSEFNAAYWKIAAGTETSFDITHSAGTEACALAVVYRGADTAWTSGYAIDSYVSPGVLGHPSGLLVVVWFAAGAGGSNLVVPGQITQDEFIESATANKSQILIAHRDTFAEAGAGQFVATSSAALTFAGALAAVFHP